MKKFFYDNRINFLFLIISFLFLISILGLDNVSYQNTEWLHDGDESAINQLSWFFFKNDIWRFPLGSNPNYGDEFGNSIVFTDLVPIFALFFKLLKSLIPGNFQYFSFWYLICFYLQLFFSFKILKKFTNSVSFSLIGSLFFLITPIFIYRIDYHAGLSGQWILLFALYLGLTHKIDKSQLSWIFLVTLSSLIFLYFTVVIIAVYSVLRIFNFYFKKENLIKVIKDFFIISSVLLLTLYIAGYFEIRVADSLNLGFGKYKLNLLSIFDPVNSSSNVSWSWFLPDIKLPAGDEIEGFNYFGLGQWAMYLFALIIFLNKNYKTNLFSITNNKEIKIFILISFLITFWSLSNQISFGPHVLLNIPLNKYIFAAFSIFGATGRLFWIVNYFLLILSIIIIYQCFKEKNSLLIITLFLVIQISDISAGLKNSINAFTPRKETIIKKNQIWDNLFNNYKILKTTYPISWSGHFTNFSYLMEKHKIEKTNLVVLARTNRKDTANARYRLYDNFRKKTLASDTVYLVYDIGHLRHLKYLFKNENVGFFYRDNVWVMVMNEKEQMNDNDKKIFNEIKPKLLAINEKKNLNFKDKDNDNYYGFGWSHNSGKLGMWSEGPTSTLFFRTDKNYGDLKLEIFCKPYITKKNNTLEFDTYVNNLFNKNTKLANNNQDEKFEILVNKELIKNNEIKIDFKFKNLVSPYEVRETPDSRKLGILIKTIKISLI
ncbi:MAG: hypothetical protein CMI82_02925 [Candidatus Pelagibacter sp.]|jgi:hypothetical protein|nr:hypothetical protein [Candidatus Pelagibacter sp.]